MTTKSTFSPKGTVPNIVRSQNSGINSPWTVYKNATLSLGERAHYTSGVNTPGFYARKRRGELLPFTGFDQYEYETSVTPSYWMYQQDTFSATTGKRVSYEAEGPGEPEKPGVKYKSSAVFYDPVVQSLASSASGWDALTFVAEAHQLRSMVVGLLTKISSLLSQRPAKFSVNQWLELRYGWRPLYYDMVGINQAINSLNSKRKFSTFTSGDTTRVVTRTTGTGDDGTMSYQVAHDINVSINIRAKLVMRGTLNPIRVNPLATAWELVKFSFVVDWLINVGQAIDALSLAMSGAHYVAGAGYKATVANRITTSSAVVVSGWNLTTNNPGSSTCDGECVSRSPAFIPLRPLLNPRLTGGRLVDFIALVLQRVL